MDRRRSRLVGLLALLQQKGTPQIKEKVAAEYSFRTGATRQTVDGYIWILLKSERVFERHEGGFLMLGTQEQWEKWEGAEVEARQERSVK